MSTWGEDFAYSLETLGLPQPGDLDPPEAYELISHLVEGIERTDEGATVAEALGEVALAGAAAALAETAGAALLLTATTYVSALIGAALYASAKQGWEAATAPIDLERMLELAKEYDAPVLELPVSEQVSWYPEVTTVHETVPEAPGYPGHVVKRGSTDSDSVERIQQALESLGYDVSIDGDFGSRTEAAIKAFQQEQGRKVDGEVGPITWKALFGS